MTSFWNWKGLILTNHIHIILEQTKDEPAIEEEPPPVYNTLEPPSDDDDDYDDTDETRCRTVWKKKNQHGVPSFKLTNNSIVTID